MATLADIQDFIHALSEWESQQPLEPEILCKELQGLVGESIQKVFASNSRVHGLESETTDYMVFEFASGVYGQIWAEADCCSETWFSDAIGLPGIIGQTITKVVTIPLSVEERYNLEDGRGRQDEDVMYGFKIVAENASAVIAFRNSSNGYYGGWLRPMEKSMLWPNCFGEAQEIGHLSLWMAD